MNLELLDPFRRQVPDRIDATLHLPTALHFRKNLDAKTKEALRKDENWKAANHIAFNRRGLYVAVGYGSGTVAVYDILSRTLSSLYRPEAAEMDNTEKNDGAKKSGLLDHGVTSLSWSRRSRTLLAGSLGNPEVKLIDTTHPYGPEECCAAIQLDENKDGDDDNNNQRSQSPTPFSPQKSKTPSSDTSFAKNTVTDHFKKSVTLQTKIIDAKTGLDIPPVRKFKQRTVSPAIKSSTRRYPSVLFKFPLGIGASLQVHPRDPFSGHAILNDGSLVVFSVPPTGFEEPEKKDEDEEGKPPPVVSICKVFSSTDYEVTCSAFDPHGEKLYAGTSDGKLMGFEVATVFNQFRSESEEIPCLQPNFVIQIPGGAAAWHVVVSRNGRYVVVNSADAALRLYEAAECWTTPEEVEKPRYVFQDVVSKIKFASVDISCDGEYVAGGAQGNDTKYTVFIWSTNTGNLIDKLTGATVDLYSLAWHPTRCYLAVAASDGLVDIWGPRINWTAFAPDFQALPQNVEYVECEDEFDIVKSQSHPKPQKREEDEAEQAEVDILTVEPVPVFQSDSEDEDDVFRFDVVTRALGNNNIS